MQQKQFIFLVFELRKSSIEVRLLDVTIWFFLSKPKHPFAITRIYKAVQLELVCEFTTAEYVMAFEKFIDDATNPGQGSF